MDGTGRLFQPLVPFVSSGFDVHVVRYPPRACTYEEIEAAIGAPPPGAVIVGESFGGPLAIRLAARHQLERVVLVASFVRPPRRLLPPAALLAALHPPPALAIRAAMLGARAPAALVREVRDAIASVPATTIAGRARTLATLDARPALAALPRPPRWLVATRDRLVPPAALAEARRARPDLEATHVDGPHLLSQVRPAEVAAVIAHAAE